MIPIDCKSTKNRRKEDCLIRWANNLNFSVNFDFIDYKPKHSILFIQIFLEKNEML